MKIFYTLIHKEHDPPFEGYNANGYLPSFEKSERAEIVRASLEETNWAEFQSPSDFGLDPILAVHSLDYLNYLRSAYAKWQALSPVNGMAFIPGTYGIDYQQVLSLRGDEQVGFFLMDTTVAISSGTYKAALHSAYCALSGAQSLIKGESAVFALNRPPGHHAGREVCGGYCYLNNAAIAARWLSQSSKVAILDVDYHAGNGTQEIFYENADVLTVSLHADPTDEYPKYAGYANEIGTDPGSGFHRNYPLPAGTDQTAYHETLGEALELIFLFAPKYLIVSAGMDIYKDEPLGKFQLTRDSIHKIGQLIACLGISTLIVMEGGYHLPSLGDNFVAFLEPFR